MSINIDILQMNNIVYTYKMNTVVESCWNDRRKLMNRWTLIARIIVTFIFIYWINKLLRLKQFFVASPGFYVTYYIQFDLESTIFGRMFLSFSWSVWMCLDLLFDSKNNEVNTYLIIFQILRVYELTNEEKNNQICGNKRLNYFILFYDWIIETVFNWTNFIHQWIV